MDKRFKIMIILVLMFITIYKPLKAEDIIYVDTRLLLCAHPLFEVFDYKTNRFKGTSSEFIHGGWDGVDAFIEEIKKKQDELLKTPETLKEKLKDVPLADRAKLERQYMLEKKEAENELQNMRMRVHYARQFPDVMGHTLDTAIAPQVNQITSDIRAIVVELKKKYKAKTVMDIADLLPLEYNFNSTELQNVPNMQKMFYNEPDKIDNVKFQKWLNEASLFWAKNWGIDCPVIPYGALDVRLESLQMLEERVRGIIR